MQTVDGGLKPLEQGDVIILEAHHPEGPFTLMVVSKDGAHLCWPNGDDKFWIPTDSVFAYMLQAIEAANGLTIRMFEIDGRPVGQNMETPPEEIKSAKIRKYEFVF